MNAFLKTGLPDFNRPQSIVIAIYGDLQKERAL
jgi:hypothetical protein